jgi:hypothetical protein
MVEGGRRAGRRQLLIIIIYHHMAETSTLFSVPRSSGTGSNWIVSKWPHSLFSVLQLGYEPKKNREQNAEQACTMLDNFYPKYFQAPTSLSNRHPAEPDGSGSFSFAIRRYCSSSINSPLSCRPTHDRPNPHPRWGMVDSNQPFPLCLS